MRTKLLKLLVVLLVVGSGDTRPQRNSADSTTQPEITTNAEQLGIVQASNKSHGIVRDDSRYIGISGNNRKSYITYFRDSVNPTYDYNTISSRTNSFVPNEMVRSYNTRHSKIEDVWSISKLKTDSSPILGTLDPHEDIAGTVQNSNSLKELSSHNFSSNPKERHNEKVEWVRSALALDRSTNFTLGQINSESINVENLEKLNTDVTMNKDFKSMIFQTRRSSVETDSVGNHSSVKGTNITGITIQNNTSIVEKDRQKLDLIGSNSLYNKHVIRNNILISKHSLSVSPSQLTNMTVNTPLYKNQHSIDKITDRNMSSYENLKELIAVPSSRLNDIQRDIVNNSEKLADKIETRLIQNSKSEIISHHPSTFHRNFVRLLHSPAISNYPNKIKYALNVSHRDVPENTSNVVTLNSKAHAEVKEDNDMRSIVIPIRESNKSQAAVRKPDSNDDANFKSMKNRHSSHTQELPSQSGRIENRNKTIDEYRNIPIRNMYSKNWPNEAQQNVEDLYNYEKYLSSLEQTDQNLKFHNQDSTDQIHTSILPLNNDYINHPDPVLESSVQKIIHWLKIPTITRNTTHLVYDNDKLYKPVESVLDSIYENLEPNRPLNVSNQDNTYPNTALQEAHQDEGFDQINYHQNYPNQWPSSNLVIRPQYVTGILTPSLWSKISSSKNHSVFNPTTHVKQDMVIHILNNDIKKPNVTQLKVPQSSIQPAITDQSSSQKPNVHVTFTSQEDKNDESLPQELNTDCPTIMINSYTRVNNTLQSKEGCTDLNIVINSHILSSNVFQPSDGPIENQQTSLGTQNYDYVSESNKHSEDDLAHQDSSESYVTASIYSPLETPQSIYNDNYNSQKDPSGISEPEESLISPDLSTIEVFQGTQISISGSNAQETAEFTGADNPAGLSADGSPIGGVDDASANAPSVDSTNVGQGFSPGTVMGQSNNALMPGSFQLPALPSKPNLPVKPSLSGVSNALASSGSTLSQDDDDDDFDLSPGSILQSITSVFTYLTFLNPLGYSIFTFAAAPFTAMAAGIFGILAFTFPWAFPSVLDFGRASNEPTIILRPHIDEFARQIIPYNRVNEWKRRRRKHRK